MNDISSEHLIHNFYLTVWRSIVSVVLRQHVHWDVPAVCLFQQLSSDSDGPTGVCGIENHSSANLFDFSPNANFGFMGDIFIAETGSIPPGTGATSLVGYKVALIDRRTGEVSDFIVHPSNDVATIFDPSGFNKAIDVKFRGADMFIVDFGVFPPAKITPGSGKIWVVSRSH